MVLRLIAHFFPYESKRLLNRNLLLYFSSTKLNFQIMSSNEHQVTLRNIPVEISGEVSCEITTDAPSFSTSCVSAALTVIELEVDLRVPKRHYNIGEKLQANCSATSSVTDTELTFHLDSRRVSYQSPYSVAANAVVL